MLGEIRALRSKLRPSEQRVAEVVLADPGFVLSASMAALAQRAAVSEPTVMRFCRALGLEGFQAFKLSLAQVLGRQVRYVQRHVQADDGPEILTAKVVEDAVASLERVQGQLDPNALEVAIGHLAAARRVEFYGLGGAGVGAADAQFKFCRLGVAAVAYSDPQVHRVTARLLEPGDVAVAISNSGRSQDLLASVAGAKASGARVVAITATGSPLAENATVALTLAPVDGGDFYAPIKARLALMVIVDILAIAVALRRGAGTLERLAKAQGSLADRFV
ncbi:MAG: SIS domain-containing protein [Candidatus Competibacterales bacterium]